MATRKFDYLKGLTGDALKNAPVLFDLSGFTGPTSGGSGHAPPGRNAVEIIRALWEETKAKNGWNFHWEGKIVEPMAFKGTPIHDRVFMGSADNARQDIGEEQINAIFWSVFSGQGKLDVAQAKGATRVSPAALVGQRVYVYLEDGEGEYANRSQVARYITREEFEAQPGPDATIVQQAGLGAGMPAPGSKPELLSGNGTKPASESHAGAKAALDSALGLG